MNESVENLSYTSRKKLQRNFLLYLVLFHRFEALRSETYSLYSPHSCLIYELCTFNEFDSLTIMAVESLIVRLLSEMDIHVVIKK